MNRLCKEAPSHVDVQTAKHKITRGILNGVVDNPEQSSRLLRRYRGRYRGLIFTEDTPTRIFCRLTSEKEASRYLLSHTAVSECVISKSALKMQYCNIGSLYRQRSKLILITPINIYK
jgi:hypothetical protein